MLWAQLITVWKRLRQGVGWCLDVLYPRDCFFCQQPMFESGYLCHDCLAELTFKRNPSCIVCGAESLLSEGVDFTCSDCLRQRPAFERVFVVARYDSAFRDLIHTFKYHRGVWLLEDLVCLMVAVYIERIAPLDLGINLVLSVPMQYRKRVVRGYNQAELLARALCKELTLPYCDNVLKRVQTGVRSQTYLHRSDRFKNALSAYRLTHPERIKGKTILLVDDVITTGATCNACAHLLRQAGAAKVYVFVLSRPLSI